MKKFIGAAVTAVALFAGASIQSADASNTYTVKSGDSLYSIALNHNLTVSELKEINGLSSDLIHPEETLEITSGEPSQGVKAAVSDNSGNYTVRDGDTLYSIAERYNTSIGKLKSWNGLSSNMIYPGQRLKVSSNGTASVSKAPASAQKAARELTVSSTAYTANCAGCSGITATGINLKANPNQKVIAVDPNVIPLGSKVYVEGYGTAIAGDTGGAIKGNKIDVFFPNRSQALNWGRKQVTIKVLN